MKLSIAIDGPAGAGKSTIAKILANKFNLMYINTGAMYRAVTLKAMEKNISYDNIEELLKLIDTMEMHFEHDDLFLNNENINEKICMPVISNNVSNYAAVSEVREKLVSIQRKMSYKYNVVMDGRDIGTVVLKDAPIKFYLTASPNTRAKRRYEELSDKGIDVNYEELLNDIIRRDYIDSHRQVNPLTKSEDAIEIDSSELTIDEVIEKMSIFVKEYLEGKVKV